MSFSLFWDFSYDILKLFCQAVKSVNNVVAKINAKTIMEKSIQQLLEEHVKDGTAKVHTHTFTGDHNDGADEAYDKIQQAALVGSSLGW